MVSPVVERGANHLDIFSICVGGQCEDHLLSFLLNIGPKGDGSVVPFEREVLKEIGIWLKKNGEAIYGTEASPFREQFEWGTITRKGNNLYLILSGNRRLWDRCSAGSFHHGKLH